MPSTPLPFAQRSRASLLLRLHNSELSSVQPHPQGALLLAGAQDGGVSLFATSNGACVQVMLLAAPAPDACAPSTHSPLSAAK